MERFKPNPMGINRLHFKLSNSGVRIIQETQPDEIYNLGAMSHVAVSFELPEYTADVDAICTLRLLEAVRILGLENAFLPSQYIRALWLGTRNATKSNYTFLPR